MKKTIYPFEKKTTTFLNQIKRISKTNIKLLKIEFEDFQEPKMNQEDFDSIYRMNNELDKFFYNERYKEIVAYLPSEIHWEWLDNQTKYKLQGTIGLHNLYEALFIGNYRILEEGIRPGVGRFYFTDDNVPFINFGADAWQMVPDNNKPYWDKGRYFNFDSQLGMYTCIIQEANHEKKILEFNFDELWLLYEDEANFSVYKLNLKLDTFFDMLFLTKGCIYWQLLFIENPSENLTQFEIKYLLKMLLGLPKVFPNEDYSPLYKVFEQEFLEFVTASVIDFDKEGIAGLLTEYKQEKTNYLK